MKTCICNSCRNLFDEDEIHWRREYVAEFWGMPAYDDFPYCPFCGSENFEEYCEETPEVTEFEYKGNIYVWNEDDEVYYNENSDEDYFMEVPKGAETL